MFLETQANEWVKLRSTNATDASFPSKAPTATAPTTTTAGVLDLSRSTGTVHNNLMVRPFGAGNDNTTFDMRVIGWKKVSTLWVPTVLCQVNCTLCGEVGVSGQPQTDTDRSADTITLASGYNSGVSTEVVSPTGDIGGHIVQDLKGHSLIEITFDMGTATSGNALVCLL